MNGLVMVFQKERDDDTPFEEQLEVMDELHRAGKVRSKDGGGGGVRRTREV